MSGGNIFLVGMMGAGKTTIGKALAARLKRKFIDTDRILVERTGVPVATIFEIEGEEGFRKRESAVLQELVEEPDCIVATGGGAVLREENRRLLRERGTVIYLRARPEHLWERIRHDTGRPLLATADPRKTLETLLLAREPLYRECAHLVVETGLQSAASLVSRVAVALERHASGAVP
jgi:shikimate kinase